MIAGLVALALIALPFGLVALACTLARRWRAPASAPLGLAGFLRLVAGETVALLRTFVVDQLLQPWVAPANPRRIERGVVPVLFVHGIYCNAGVWRRLLAHLRREGVPNLFCLNLAPPFAGVDHFAQQLARRVEEACQACGTPQAILVAHSMGGLVARAWCARLNGRLRLARLVTIGTPHRGSRLARLVPGRCAAEMVVGSQWLSQLAADEAQARALPLTCVFSWHDSLVAPQDSASLPGSRTLALERLGHMQLLLDAAVHRRVAGEIADARSGSPS
jgi:pimeloyl-ACP methyl ester carboxylesterase